MFDSITSPRQRAFLAAFAECGIVREAAQLAQISRETHYDWKARHPDYRAAFEAATEIVADALEDEAMRRALDPQRRSDKLLLSMLAAAKREKYGRTVTHTGEVKLSHAVDLSALTEEELDTLERFARKASEPRSDPGRTDAAQAEPDSDVLSDLGDV